MASQDVALMVQGSGAYASPRQEVIIHRTVRDVGGANWPVLTRTNYGEWAVLMKVKLRARKLWRAIEEGTEDEEEDCAAMEAILSAVPHDYVESLGAKDSAKAAWDALKAMRIGNVDPAYARGYKVMFSDGYPFLLLSQGSLNALNALLQDPIPVNRFRPNIVVDGCEPFSEDLWTEVRINGSTFNGVKLCGRCKVPTINQETAVGGSEPTQTLTSFRSDRVLRPDKKKPQGKVYFGQNIVCKDTLSEGKGKSIKVGDPLFVVNSVLSAADAAA
ncbi:Molybdenum cofactor sulfurase family protein [Striga hermonthica]|uniref:Molybdenum cofactor sulfurase family protein n=1 Tax=Striga hermonthica TaxID=68872 RepID=A0A9N7N653_STRHE|nr:Molybdenum cofactor sulfurase family protein [Striga hermonthica]